MSFRGSESLGEKPSGVRLERDEVLLLKVVQDMSGLVSLATYTAVYELGKRRLLRGKYVVNGGGPRLMRSTLESDLKKFERLGLIRTAKRVSHGKVYHNVQITQLGKSTLQEGIQQGAKAGAFRPNEITNLDIFVNRLREKLGNKDGFRKAIKAVTRKDTAGNDSLQASLFDPVLDASPPPPVDLMGQTYPLASQAWINSWEAFVKLRASKPADDWENYDQFAASEQSVMKELIYMKPFFGESTFVLLGGNDGLPLLIDSLAGENLIRPPAKMIIVEQDSRLVAWLKDAIRHVPAEIVEQDLSDPLPASLLQVEQSVVFADPPYNCAGMSLWCMRAAQISSIGNYFFLCVPTGAEFAGILDPFVTNEYIRFGFGLRGKMDDTVHYPKYGGVSSNLCMLLKISSDNAVNTRFAFDVHHSCRSENSYCQHIRPSPRFSSCAIARDAFRRRLAPIPIGEDQAGWA